MIRYALLCPKDHAFEAWFHDSDAFDRQGAAGQVACPACGAIEIRKAVMAPAVRRTSKRRPAAPVPTETRPEAAPAAAPVAAVPEPSALRDPEFARMRSALREIHARLKRDAEDVGPAFPEQARRIHEGDQPPRAIYGTATDDEVRALVEDGVGVLPIPILPDDRN